MSSIELGGLEPAAVDAFLLERGHTPAAVPFAISRFGVETLWTATRQWGCEITWPQEGSGRLIMQQVAEVLPEMYADNPAYVERVFPVAQRHGLFVGATWFRELRSAINPSVAYAQAVGYSTRFDDIHNRRGPIGRFGTAGESRQKGSPGMPVMAETLLTDSLPEHVRELPPEEVAFTVPFRSFTFQTMRQMIREGRERLAATQALSSEA